METAYVAKATAKGGRNGHVKSIDGALDVDVRSPKEMGGEGGVFLNPEILFAGGYAACFDSALQHVARAEKITLGETEVTAEVGIGKNDQGGFSLSVVLNVVVPGLAQEEAQALVEKAHQVCPYSNATRGNIDVQLNVAVL